MPRALPGFQPLPVMPSLKVEEPPLVLTPIQRERQAYEASFAGRLCYYGRVIDQEGEPVSEALVLIVIEQLGFHKPSYVKCRTSTDALGRFSIVGGIGTHARIAICKKGYTSDGRRGTLRGNPEEKLFSTPLEPQTITIWKNTGIDRSKIKYFYPMEFNHRGLLDYSVPLPKIIRFDLVRGIKVEDEKDDQWDVQMEYNLDEAGAIVMGENNGEDGRFLTYYHISINNGKMAYLDDPLPGFVRPSDGFVIRDMPGVFLNALKAPRLPYLYRAENRIFQFQSRGGKVHGVCHIVGGVRGPESMISFSVYSAVNPTGSPALFEIEPNENALSAKGFPLSE
jgi:hypothetical protein